MLTLSVDTSSQTGSLAVLRDDAILGVLSTSSDEAYSSRMFRHLEYILSEVGIGLSAIDLYSVLSGPGSFTGLRVGLAAVKGWAEVYERPIAAVSGLEAVASEARVLRSTIAAIQDARRGQIFAALYARGDGRLELRQPVHVASPADFLDDISNIVSPSELAFASTSPDIVRQPLAQSPFAQCPVVRVSPVLAPVVGRLGIEYALRGEVVTALELDAAYIRRTDAEMHWKQLE
jgi:tRNA threonylcarbamoyladenosine biosynthesis protein TsaB